MILELAIVVAAYLLGSIPSALLVVWAATGDDVREEGSGNVGATNALRTAGWKVGVLVTLMDAAKGVVPIVVMSTFNPSSRWGVAAAIAAVLGHCYPVWLRFRGGKGVATAFGAFAVLTPLSTAAALVVWLLVLAVGRVVSLASMVAAATFPILVFLVDRPPMVVMAGASVVVTIVILRHAANLRDLVGGRERGER